MHKTMLSIYRVAASLLLGSLLACATAQSDEGVDPPARVGSVSALRGEVDMSPQAGDPWTPARINQPVTTGVALWAPPGSQAEVRIGSASVRLDGNTQAVFSRVDDQQIALDVPQGTVRARVRNLPPGDTVSFTADGVRAEAREPGDFRVAYDPDRRAYTVSSFDGRLTVATPTNSFNLEAGQQVLVEQGGGSVQLRGLAQRDDFDRWAEARDREQDRPTAARYVSPEMTGIDALENNGQWDVTDEDGPVWYPTRVVSGWAPYRYGQWAYVAPWGWTWIDDAPWGYAPFHYGRWALIGSRWGWCPGRERAVRPVWAPALVGYVGGHGGGGSISIGIGAGAPVGWFPLAPREFYRPPYRSSVTYVNQVNVTNVTIVNNGDRRARRPQPVEGSYRYAQRPEALTVVNADAFRNARPIGRERIDVTPRLAQQLRPVAATAPVLPAAPRPPLGTQRGLPPQALQPGRPEREALPQRPPIAANVPQPAEANRSPLAVDARGQPLERGGRNGPGQPPPGRNPLDQRQPPAQLPVQTQMQPPPVAQPSQQPLPPSQQPPTAQPGEPAAAPRYGAQPGPNGTPLQPRAVPDERFERRGQDPRALRNDVPRPAPQPAARPQPQPQVQQQQIAPPPQVPPPAAPRPVQTAPPQAVPQPAVRPPAPAAAVQRGARPEPVERRGGDDSPGRGNPRER